MTAVASPPDADREPLLPRRVRAGLLVAVLLTGAQGLLALRPDLEVPAVTGDLLQDAVDLLAAALVAWRALARPTNRAAWSCLAAGLFSYALGAVAAVAVVEHLEPEPYPSVADALWLAFYPLAYLALVLLLRARVAPWHASMWLDGMVAALAFTAYAVHFAFEPLVSGVQGGPAEAVVNLAYPTADLVLLALVVASATILGWRASLALALLGVALVTFMVADVVFLVALASGGYTSGGLVGVLWLVAVTVMATASWCDREQRVRDRPQDWVVLLQPVVFLLVSTFLLAHEALEVDGLPVVIVLATTAVTVACGRMVLTYREVRSLADARQQARTDDLTGLSNRRHLGQRVQELQGTPFAILLVDLDRFKEVNDSFGHGVGDELLVAVAHRLRAEVAQDAGLLARLGGDEFGVVLPGADESACAELVTRLQQALQEPFTVCGMSLHVEASTGAAVCGDGATAGLELFRMADVAMYAAKRARTGYQVYERGTEDDALLRLQTLEDFRTALTDGQLVPHYQPQLDLRTGRVLAVEALARWQHPSRGLLGPASFLPVAERAGLVGPLFVRIARCALADARRWRGLGLQLEVSVNMSAAEVQDPALPETVAALLAEAGLPGSVLKIEVTESALIADPERGRRVIDRLRALGVRMSLDDFGTGYSSLSYLPSLPVQEVKLDRSFVAALTSDPRTAAVVRSTLDLAHQLGLETVAEGIEDPEALSVLADWGCDVAQGYYIAKPMPADLLARWLTESPWLTGDVTISGPPGEPRHCA